MEQDKTPLRPLVVGTPRSGFTLLCSVVIHFVPFRNSKYGVKDHLMNALIETFGPHISRAIRSEFARHGISRDLLYNGNFRELLGGPKWLDPSHSKRACVRKYLGVRGLGDFTLNIRHPKEVLDAHEVVHSHSAPRKWLEDTDYAGYTKFASLRNPAGIVNSAVFSINALTSEYIQNFISDDGDGLRQKLALYKLTHRDFFEGLVRFQAAYWKEFLEVKDQFHLMKWEDLIQNPVPTILKLSHACSTPVHQGYAEEIWKKLDHVNLTGHHKHNYRRGMGIVGGWRQSLVNEHLEILRAHGLEDVMKELGYGPIEFLNPKEYTPYQRQVESHLKAGTVYEDYPDQDLFTFAFNKTNLVSDKFVFQRHDWKTHTQVERSCFKDEALQNRVWDRAEKAVGEFNSMIEDVVKTPTQSLTDGKAALHLLTELRRRHSGILGTEGFAPLIRKYKSEYAPSVGARAWRKLNRYRSALGFTRNL